MVRGILERIRERRRRVEEAARALEARGVAPRAARRLARLVASGEYTLDEVLEAYRRTRRQRVRRLTEDLSGGGSRGGLLGSLGALGRLGGRLSGELWGSLGLPGLGEDILGLGSTGPCRARRRKC